MSKSINTYVACSACGEPESDLRYYAFLQAWNVSNDQQFEFVSCREKRAAVLDPCLHSALQRSLETRLQRSTNLLLIIDPTTKDETDWVPFEIRYAVDTCRLPVIVAYPGYGPILNPVSLAYLWPPALHIRIHNGSARVIHVPFEQVPIADAVSRFTPTNFPSHEGLGAIP